ncbi:MAG: aromatic hydrocarbon degradation protein, partial [Flavisolibacter sp.]
MKKLYFLLLTLVSAAATMAQEPVDALRYSWATPGGTARVQAVGGAMGSLGGDITATFVNPAGLAFYKTGDILITPAYHFGNTKADYLSRTEKDKTNKFTWGTSGFVIGGSGNGKNVLNTAFSLAYNRTADFNSDILYRGMNSQSSYSQKYLEEIQHNGDKDANVIADPSPDLRPNYAYGTTLAFNTYWIDTVGGGTNGNFSFQSRSANLLSTGLLQQNIIKNRGGIDEPALGFAVNLKDKLFIGGSIGIPILHYSREAEFLEADATDNPNNHFNYAMVNETLTTSGVGVNLKAGLIYKPVEYWRLGLSIHTPTFYSLTDHYEDSITTDAENGAVLVDRSRDYTNNAPSENSYSYTTPYKVIASVSYVIREIQDVSKQRGFLTADVEYINYKASSFSPQQTQNTAPDEGTKSYLKQL